jgi:tRNA (guanine37-N1)-methyltransferase
MRFDIVTLFPDMVLGGFREGVTARAISDGRVTLKVWNPRDFAKDRYRTVDDRPYGGGPGMVMRFEPLRDAIHAARLDCSLPATVIYLSPQGSLLNQRAIVGFAGSPRLILIAGRYEGVDERLIEAEIDAEWSIGDYVLSGGELAAMVLLDAIVRLLPGVLGHEDSARQDSHMAGLLDCPHYTRPEVVDGRRVPSVLLSGDHEAIRRWRLRQSLLRTRRRRPDLFESIELDGEQLGLLKDSEQENQQLVNSD